MPSSSVVGAIAFYCQPGGELFVVRIDGRPPVLPETFQQMTDTLIACVRANQASRVVLVTNSVPAGVTVELVAGEPESSVNTNRLEAATGARVSIVPNALALHAAIEAKVTMHTFLLADELPNSEEVPPHMAPFCLLWWAPGELDASIVRSPGEPAVAIELGMHLATLPALRQLIGKGRSYTHTSNERATIFDELALLATKIVEEHTLSTIIICAPSVSTEGMLSLHEVMPPLLPAGSKALLLSDITPMVVGAIHYITR